MKIRKSFKIMILPILIISLIYLIVSIVSCKSITSSSTTSETSASASTPKESVSDKTSDINNIKIIVKGFEWQLVYY